MPKITISNLDEKVVDFKLNNEAPLSILAILQENNIDWMHACGGKGNCTSCRCNVVDGNTNLSLKTEAELQYTEAGQLLKSQRLACQARPLNNVAISVPDKNKLPSINYTN